LEFGRNANPPLFVGAERKSQYYYPRNKLPIRSLCLFVSQRIVNVDGVASSSLKELTTLAHDA
jgi:hypothetical protein